MVKKFYIKQFIFICLLLASGKTTWAQINFEDAFGSLFEEVQTQAVFPDSKTFPDCIPLYAPDKIMREYRQNVGNTEFDLKEFVLRNFKVPQSKAKEYESDRSRPVEQHINQLWEVLQREPDTITTTSLIPLPHPYVVPGGRFREVYYWDSYFTMLGLQVSGKTDLIEHILDNFAYLIDTVGFIPNGNRTYYLGRSQPPFFASMVSLLAKTEGDFIFTKYLPAILKEYNFWMEGKAGLTAQNPAHRRVVRLQGGEILNRYWDDKTTPRPEAYKEDMETAKKSGRDAPEVYRHLRAAAESGWDFCSRWFKDGQTLATIHTTEIIPVDLNSLLYNMEMTLSHIYQLQGNKSLQEKYRKLAQIRQQALRKYCWDTAVNYYTDYDFVARQLKKSYSLAGLYPLFFKLVSPKESRFIADFAEKTFLSAGGVLSTTVPTGEQWDAPNGWPPLEWITIRGLKNYGFESLANIIADRWVRNNIRVYKNTGKLVEKYNVQDITLDAGGGEYALQDGFGWTNGVLLKLLSEEK